MAPIRIAIMMLLEAEVREGLLRGRQRERDWFGRREGDMEGEWNTDMK